MHGWTEQETNILLENIDNPVDKWAHLIPDRTVGSIITRAHRLGYTVNRNLQGNIERKFWKHVKRGESNECWNWVGAKNFDGYGTMRGEDHRQRLAHRVSWELHNGPIPESHSYHGSVIMHTCDNPRCVNPSHLKLGTQADNMQDMHDKGRGSYHPSTSVLTENQVRSIKQMLATGKMSMRSIAEQFNVSHTTIWLISQGKSWASVKT